MRNYKISFGTFLIMLVLLSFTANAQDQPQIQVASIRAPQHIKIDGKLNEWADPFLNAYNSASRIYYTVSNDDDNLYLTVRGLGTAVANKVLSEGITFTISHTTEKKFRSKAKDNVAITFPERQNGKTVKDIMDPINSLGRFLDDTIANRKQIDSVISLVDKRVNAAVKTINIIGVKEVPDPVISVYNTQGIKAAIQFIKRQPVIELAIPLKYLGLSVNNPVKFSYNIKLNGPPVQPDIAFATNNPDLMKAGTDGPPNPNVLYMESAVDFWGEYILAVKQ